MIIIIVDLLLLLTIDLSPAVTYFCATIYTYIVVILKNMGNLFVTYAEAFKDYHKEDSSMTIKCAFLKGQIPPNKMKLSVVPNG